MKESDVLYSVGNSEIQTLGIAFLVNGFNYELKRFPSQMIDFADSAVGRGGG